VKRLLLFLLAVVFLLVGTFGFGQINRFVRVDSPTVEAIIALGVSDGKTVLATVDRESPISLIQWGVTFDAVTYCLLNTRNDLYDSFEIVVPDFSLGSVIEQSLGLDTRWQDYPLLLIQEGPGQGALQVLTI
jgi:hypothetical protein